jgi:putative PIN family toxin of toxin-antitoxin system
MTSKIVFDTSSLVSAALRPKSIPAPALQLTINHHQLSVSVDSLAEIERILNQDKFNKYNNLAVRKEFLRRLRRDSSLQAVPEEVSIAVRGSCRDGKDDFILALALAERADAIISSDRDLLSLNPWRGIPILTPAQFVSQFSV